MSLLPTTFRGGGTSGNRGVLRRRGVSVRIGNVAPNKKEPSSAYVCVVGMGDFSTPLLSDRYPRALVRKTRHALGDGCVVEHLRLNSRNSLVGLPNLSDPYPSRLQDAVGSMLAVGVPYVDLVMVRMPDLRPFDFHRADVFQAVDPLLADLRGALLTFPDMGGPPPQLTPSACSYEQPRRGRPSLGDQGQEYPTRIRAAAMLMALKRWSGSWPERFQFALLDAIDLEGEDEVFFLKRLVGMDCSLCKWEGDRFMLRRHGWRSAAAVMVGGIMGLPRPIGAAYTGLSIPLTGGRYLARDRKDLLRLEPEPSAFERTDATSAYIRLRLDSRADVIRIQSEPTLRRPLGGWPLPSVLIVKIIHRSLIEAAEAFVFSQVDNAQAIALGVSLQRVLMQFHRAGLVVGPDGEGPPQVQGSAVRDPRSPGLSAEVQAQIRPWNQHITVRVAVRPGARPSIEES